MTRRGARMALWEIASDNSSPGWMRLLSLFMELGIDFELCQTLKEITDDGVIAEDSEGALTEIKGDSVVVCAGYDPDNALYNELKGEVEELYLIGDAVKARLIGDAIHEGWLVANQL